MNWDLNKLQQTLTNTQNGLNKLEDNLNLLQLEQEYQNYINQFSPAYLSGSSWYVGNSIIKYLEKKKINQGMLSAQFFISNKISNNN